LSELRGRYDVVLKYVARHPGCSNGDLVDHVREVSRESPEQVGGYLKVLTDKYRMIEKRLPIFAKPNARKGRYHIRDNFLRVWLDALTNPVQAINFRPTEELVMRADERIADAEGFGLERLVRTLYEERSRKARGDFRLSRHIEGFWDRKGIEIDLVALDEEAEKIRFGTCKRSPAKLVKDMPNNNGHIERFLDVHSKYRGWTIERVAIAPMLDAQTRAALTAGGYRPEDLADLTADL
jgi:hypothetical protein